MRKYIHISVIIGVLPLDASACDDYVLGHDLSVLIGSVIFSTLFAVSVIGVAWLIKIVSTKLFAITKERFELLTVSFYLSSMALALFGLLAIPQFKAFFEIFGGDLPLATRLLLDYHYLTTVPFAIVLFYHGFDWPSRKNLTGRISLFIFQIAAISVTLFSLYLPVFKMC